jgi:hypothetical protein
MSTVYQLLYLSKATTPTTQQALEQVVAREAQRNQPLGLTGILIHSHGFFVELLEGEQTAVRTTYNSIATDARHRNLHILHASGGAKAPLFAGQGMSLLNLDTAGEATRQTLSLLCQDLNQSPNGRKVLSALRDFRSQSAATSRPRKAA